MLSERKSPIAGDDNVLRRWLNLVLGTAGLCKAYICLHALAISIVQRGLLSIQEHLDCAAGLCAQGRSIAGCHQAVPSGELTFRKPTCMGCSRWLPSYILSFSKPQAPLKILYLILRCRFQGRCRCGALLDWAAVSGSTFVINW